MNSISHFEEDDYLSFFQKGEELGLTRYFELYYPVLVNFAQGYVKDLHLAEDITGEAFIKLWERRSSFGSAYAIRAFLYVVVRNASLSYLRKHKQIQKQNNELAYLSSKHEGTILERILQTEKLDDVYAALKTLPKGCGEVIRLIYIEGKNYKEIAKELNLSISTIRNHRSRGISLLKKKLLPALIYLMGQEQFL